MFMFYVYIFVYVYVYVYVLCLYFCLKNKTHWKTLQCWLTPSVLTNSALARWFRGSLLEGTHFLIGKNIISVCQTIFYLYVMPLIIYEIFSGPTTLWRTPSCSVSLLITSSGSCLRPAALPGEEKVKSKRNEYLRKDLETKEVTTENEHKKGPLTLL